MNRNPSLAGELCATGRSTSINSHARSFADSAMSGIRLARWADRASRLDARRIELRYILIVVALAKIRVISSSVRADSRKIARTTARLLRGRTISPPVLLFQDHFVLAQRHRSVPSSRWTARARSHHEKRATRNLLAARMLPIRDSELAAPAYSGWPVVVPVVLPCTAPFGTISQFGQSR